MQEQIYIVIGMTEDGSFIESVTKAEIESRINTDFYGPDARYMTTIPDISIDEWPAHSILIVRASAIVVPRDRVAIIRVVD